jgi:hypothetical protein
VLVFRNLAGIRPLQHFAHAFFYHLKGLMVAPSCERIPILQVFMILIRIPSTVANLFNQRFIYPLALD